jgi:hypothetical protein
MATITTYKIDGQQVDPFRDALDVTISLNFGLEVQPSISLDSINFVDTDRSKNAQKVTQLWRNLPTEGAPFSITVTGLNENNQQITLDFPFYFDYTKLKFLSDVELEVGLLKESSLQSFEDRAAAITQRLLYFKQILNQVDYENVPYVVENRKTLLEQISLVYQAFNIAKTIADEVHKILNLASDIPTLLGSIPAIANLGITITALIALTDQLFDQLVAVQEAFFPLIKYHKGIKPKTFIEKAVIDYMGYDGVQFGTLDNIMNRLVWLGHKDSEKGLPAALPLSSTFPGAGLLKPSDTGYFLVDCKDVIKTAFRCREAIIDNIYHLRPENDPFWVLNSNYVLPSVLVEQALTVSNGTKRPNYEEATSSTIIQYATDDSDLWTLEDLKDEQDPATTGKIISVTTVEPINVVDRRRILLRGGKSINIPFALAVRKSPFDDLASLFLGNVDGFNTVKDIIADRFNEFSANLSGSSIPAIAQFGQAFQNREGALKIENEFFSVPKMMLLETNSSGFPTIPLNFADEIGAQALYNNYHTWDSFIQGNRNPNEPSQTAGKSIFEGVRMPFGIADVEKVQQNSYFTTSNGEVGKFTKIEWNVRGDFAIVDFWIYDDWLNNIEENVS